MIAPDAEHVRPSREYLQALLDGARERGLPEAYVAALGAVAAPAERCAPQRERHERAEQADRCGHAEGELVAAAERRRGRRSAMRGGRASASRRSC